MTRIQCLAYFVAESTAPEKWRDYGEQMLGMAAHTDADGTVRLKMDAQPWRITAVKGAQDRYLASGWLLNDDADFEATVKALEAAGVALEHGAAHHAAERGYARMAAFVDPAGNRHELVTGRLGAPSPFTSPIGVGNFVTRSATGTDLGLGHVVLPAAATFDPTLKLFRDVLGFGLSDVFNFQPGPDAPVIRIYFLHAACGRHHSIALAEMPNPAGCVHAMVEVGAMTDVGRAYDRVKARGVKLMATLGQHENDRMTSFYMMTPGNFALEYGWGGIAVDPATWQTTMTKEVSIWGHDFSVGFQN
ncbi:MAG: biphenyl 2,3-dioxygenase [Nevskiaceae bacterium]|nr:MAG: biphenyl 2,3-dioxygenase [Nevskiaceae bacterium]TBR71391.1 MAG: biphenyl 2,3-dioxygenase [Nevskiaceae bacterium]